VLLGRDLCGGRITHAGGHTKCGVSECDHEASAMRMPRPAKDVEP